MINADWLIEEKIAIVLSSKDEMIEFVQMLQEELGEKLYQRGLTFYSSGKVYDECIRTYGSEVFGDLVIRLSYFNKNGLRQYQLNHSTIPYYMSVGYRCIYYCDIRDDFAGIDLDLNLGNNIESLFR